MKKTTVAKAVACVIAGVVLTGFVSEASATGVTAYTAVGNAAGANYNAPLYVWDGGNIGFGPGGAGDCTTNSCDNLPGAGRGRVGGADAMSGSVEDDRNMGWNHTAVWRSFEITDAGGYTISMTRAAATSTNWQPAFSVWTSGANKYLHEAGSHKFNQVTAPVSVTPDVLNGSAGHNDNLNDYMLADDIGNNAAAPITGFVGYANSGAGYVNAGGLTVLGALEQGTSVEGTKVGATYPSIVTKGAFTNAHAGNIEAEFAGAGSSVNTTNPTLANANGGGYADMQLWLTPGWYTFVGGGSCADFTCSPTAAALGSYNLKVLTNSAVTAPVPVPGAVWLFGSAIAGFLGLRRSKKIAA